ncbi:MAG TPA: hypothetical protein VM716_14390 [Gemmatimonadales bacterium]|nr:hypothetical protein [Gemmatimonadales bacterium]
MSDTALWLYHRLPSSARSVAASLRGYYLRWWRYGAETDRLIAEALERDHWTATQWDLWREERLAYVLHRAATHVPYYREHWRARRRRGDHASRDILTNWPPLDKEALRTLPEAFLADDCPRSRLRQVHTSGTTGSPITIWRTRETERALYALAAARRRRWYGISHRDPCALLGGQLVTPASQQRPPFWVWNAALNQLYMSSYHLAPAYLPYYLDALARHSITYLEGYTSSLYALAQEVLQLGRRDLRLAVAIPNAEPVYDYQRQAIAAAFQCPVRETYGMAECVAAASECTGGRLHLWPEVGCLEVLEGDGRGGGGELLATGLMNADMPLIRYQIGDRGALAATSAPCPCGRSLPILAAVEGRVDDVLYTADGRRIGRLDPVFKADLPVREAQIVQDALDRVRVRYVPTAAFTPDAARCLVDRVQARMGAVAVVLEPVSEVPRTTAGKFRAVVSNLTAAERAAIRAVDHAHADLSHRA